MVSMAGAFCCAAARFMPDIVAASPSIRQQRDNALAPGIPGCLQADIVFRVGPVDTDIGREGRFG
jgi:hypothetical protein